LLLLNRLPPHRHSQERRTVAFLCISLFGERNEVISQAMPTPRDFGIGCCLGPFEEAQGFGSVVRRITHGERMPGRAGSFRSDLKKLSYVVTPVCRML